jgi:glutathione synthase/RimK-type ligase-like ATP-grasp enzyme
VTDLESLLALCTKASSPFLRSLHCAALCASLSLLASSSALALESLDDIARSSSKLSFPHKLELAKEEREASALAFSQKLEQGKAERELAKEEREASALAFSQKLEQGKAERENAQLVLMQHGAAGTLAVTALVGAGASWGMVEVNRQNLNQTVKNVVEETQAPLKADIAQLKTNVTELKTDVAGLKSTVDQILVFLQNGGAPQPTKGR